MNYNTNLAINKDWPRQLEIEPDFDPSVKWPRITIITPSYNQGHFLEETILSVLNQKYPDLEYFVIDGGSTDNSVAIIKKYKERIDYWVSERDRGQSDAINKGFRRATGDIVAWLNSDDYYLPGCLKFIAENYRNNNGLGFVFGNTLIFGYRKNKSIPYNTEQQQITMLDLLVGMPYSQTSTFYNKKSLNKVGILDERLHYCMDYDLSIRLLLCYDFLRLNEVLSKSRFHLESKSSKSRNKFRSELIVVFSKIINSVPFEDSVKDKLERVGLYKRSEQAVPITRNFDKVFQDALLKRYVYEVIRHAYSGFIAEDVKKYCKVLKKEFPEEYHSFNIEQYNRKCQNYTFLIPKFNYYIRRKIKQIIFGN